MSDESTNLPEHVPTSEVVHDAGLEASGFEVAGVDAGGLGDALGGLDLGSLLGAAQNMQAQMLEAQERIAATLVEGQSGGGAVRVTVSGGYEFDSVSIDPASIDPDDITLLEDLVLAALRDAATKVVELHAEASPLGGLDLGGLGAMFGAG